MPEKTIPWWRRALNLALDGLRSGFGFFPQPVRREPIAEAGFSVSSEKPPEEETTLTEPLAQPEAAVAAPPIPAEPEAEPYPAAEPVPAPAPEMTTAAFFDPVPGETDSAETAEPEAADEPVTEPEEVAEAVSVPEPEAAEAVETEPGVAEAEPEAAETPEPEAVSEPVEEPVESVEAAAETEPEAAETLVSEAENEPVAEPGEVAEVVAVPEPEAVETVPEAMEANETEAMIETVPEQVEGIEAAAVPEPEAAPQAVSADAVEEAVPVADPPVVEAGATPPCEPPAAVEAEPAVTPGSAPAPELVPEPESASQLAQEPAPAPEAAVSAALSTRPTAEEKAAARLAARQKKLDESAEQSPFSVIVGQVYDGPLDLLLDLIRKQDIDLYDIPIARITAQFLAYVNQLRASDVDVAGEFIYTASLLIHIKSRMLLPRTDAAPEEAAEDPRRELVERLLEHERFKNAAQMLQQKQMLEAATWTNPGLREFQDDEAAEPEIAADTVDLVRVFREILERARKRPILDVSEDSVTVSQMIQFLARRLNMEDKPVALRRLLSHTHSERALIAMFLALLELVRLQAVLLRQDRQFSEIFIKKHTGFDAVMNEGLTNARDDWR